MSGTTTPTFTYSQALGVDGSVRADAVLRSDGLIVLDVAGSQPWEQYQAWLKAGNTLAPATLTAVQETRIAFLKGACGAAIIGGYTSSALGSPHVYPSGQTDQLNMAGSVLASLLPGLPSTWTTPFWCQDTSTGAWAMVEHTASQIQQAGADGKAWVASCQQKLASLTAQVQAATTAAAVLAISW